MMALLQETFLNLLLEYVRKVFYLATTSIKRSRVGIGKVKMQIDLTSLDIDMFGSD